MISPLALRACTSEIYSRSIDLISFLRCLVHGYQGTKGTFAARITFVRFSPFLSLLVRVGDGSLRGSHSFVVVVFSIVQARKEQEHARVCDQRI